MTNYTDKDRPVHKRREFIKLGAAGVVGSLAACAVPNAQQEAASEAMAPERVPDRGLSEVEPVPPEVGDLVDPELLPAETWQEP